MNEVQRMQYLDALGIDSFMPRRILPNAPVMSLCEPVTSGATTAPVETGSAAKENLPIAASQAGTPVAAMQSAAEPKAIPAVSAIESVPAKVAPAVLEQVATVTEQVKAEPKATKTVVPTPRFSLSLWQVGEQLLVIDSRQPQQALPTESLLSNILLALGFPAGPLPSAHVVRWPIMENRFESQGADEARGMLSALISARLETQPANHVLLMGEEACHYILPGDQLADTQAESLTKLQGRLLAVPELAAGLPVIVVPSLTAMLQEPELKAITWQAIQPLRQ